MLEWLVARYRKQSNLLLIIIIFDDNRAHPHLQQALGTTTNETMRIASEFAIVGRPAAAVLFCSVVHA